MERIYKIVREGNRTLYHGINGSTFLPSNQWIKADKKMVKDGTGGKEYLSGIHCFKDLDKGEKYLDKFKQRRDLIIISCLGKGLRQKPTNKNVWLADEIFIEA